VNRGFRLATVLRVRRIQQDIARAEVLRAAAAEAAAGAAVAAIDSRLDAARPPAAAVTGRYLAQTELHLMLADDLSLARQDRDEAAGVTGRARTEFSRAAGRTRGLEVLSERHHAAVRAADERLAQREIDDRAGYTTAIRRDPR
jgi:hypothetical protein